MKVAYWPGCVSRGFTPELHGSMAKVAPLLDLELVELDRASCCGAGVIAEHNQELADTLNARTFALAQQVEGADADDEHLLDVPGRADRVPGAPRRERGVPRARQRHLAADGLRTRRASRTRTCCGCWSRTWASTSSSRASSARSRPRVGPFYGCYIVRPTDRLGIDREHPRDTYLHQVIEALGGTVIEYAGQYKCCGFPIITMNKEVSLKQAGRHLGDAVDAEADCLVTPCPLCHLNLDLQQPLAERVGRAPPQHAGPAPAAAHRPRPRPRAERARHAAPRREAGDGDRLDDVRRRRGRGLTPATGGRAGGRLNRPAPG